MLAQELLGLEHRSTFFRGDQNDLRSRVPELLFIWPQLGHALDAVGSPGTPKEFQNNGPACDEVLQSHLDGRTDSVELVSGPKRKTRSRVADFQSVTIACHPEEQ